MSSRRKSRPVRRFYTPNGELLHSLEATADGVFEEQPYQDSLPTPEDSPENTKIESDSRKLNSEGVFVLQPQGVSDDEGQEVKPTQGLARHNSNHIECQNSDIPKKRQLNGIEEVENKIGLDLSVKRRKTEEEMTERSSPDGKEIQNFFPASNYQTNMQRFENFVQLFAAKRKSLEKQNGNDLIDDGNSDQPVITPQSPMGERLENEEYSTNVRNQDGNTSPSPSLKWDQQPNRSGSDSWDEKFPSSQSSSPTASVFNSSLSPAVFNSSLTPAVAAAMMASLVSSNPESRNFSGSNAKSEVLQNLFKQRSLQQPFAPLKENSVQYSTSPDAMDTITAGTVSSGVGSIKRGTLDPTNFDEEVFDKYISRYNAKNPCMQSSCPHINRDHFHCTDSDCNFQRFTNKSDVIRHYNMHKKRDNSLAHGFMRFAPTDNCQSQFGMCHLNGKSTHYHCLHPNCTRVYTSTSDVMTHENFHKKNQHFATNGFQRFRATETCDSEMCPFRDQRTTHFHCTRKDCNFTFKNKCDIDKHKAYHMRDDAYTRQGFKKFYKNEACGFQSCAWNRTANHFHCLRPSCQFSFTSTGQMVSHKRKHDRQDLLSLERSEPTSQPFTTLSVFPSHLSSSSSSASVSKSGTQHPYADINATKSKAFRSLSLLHPLLGASLLRRAAAPMAVKPGTSVSSNLNLTSFQEAARKVLAAIPTSVAAAALPRGLNNSFMRSESGSLPLSYNNVTSSAQSFIRPSENSVSNREELNSSVTPERSNPFRELPPPPYLEVPTKTAVEGVTKYEHMDRYREEDEREMHEDWQTSVQRHNSLTSPAIQKNPFAFLPTTDQSPKDADDKILNLSSKNSTQEEGGATRSLTNFGLSAFTSPSLLKYFRGYSPNECKISTCVFVDRYHFHCIVDDCNATFVDRALVLTHTLFHDKLEKLGVSQSSTKSFPLFYPPLSRSFSTNEANSPPPGYIALPITGNKPKEIKRETDRPGLEPISSNIDQKPKQEEDSPRQESREASPPATSEVENPTPRDPHSAVYEYISRIIHEKNSMAGLLPLQHTSSSGGVTNPYSVLRNPAMMVSFARSQSCTYPMAQDDLRERYLRADSTSVPNDGYMHVRVGSACIRPDCKYLLQNHWHCTMNRCRYVCKSLAKAQSHRQAHNSLEAYAKAAKESFQSYTVKKNCPNPNCEFRLRGHYHCLKTGCNFVTIGTSKLPWHMKKHEKIAKREASGFKYYTKKDQCGRRECKYNGMFSHYHCIRAGCSFAFQYKHQMSTHVRKHIRRMLGRSYSGADITLNTSRIDHTNVDSGDESLPLIVDEADEIEQRPGVRTEVPSHQTQSHPSSNLSEQQLTVLQQLSKGLKSTLAAASGNQSTDNNNNNNHQFSNFEKEDDRDALSNDDMDENSTNDEILDLRSNNMNEFDSNSNSSANSEFKNDFSGNPHDMQDDAEQQPMEQDNSPTTGFVFSTPDQQESSGPLFSKFRLNNDVMSGFRRFEITENCSDSECQFSQKVSHYHCLHEDCTYRFTGRTHMFKHRQHHERVAGLVRDDFKRFKATQNCQSSECLYNGNNTHFHCLRCSFKCTDSAKVGAHRRQHVKADTLEQSGFERFRGKEDCGRESCKYRNRNTSHFHCLQPGCSYAVVGLSGIEQHANKHKRLQMQPSEQVNFSIITKPLISQPDSALNASIFANSSLLPNSNMLTYSVPLDGLSTASRGISLVNDLVSPATEEQPSVPPSFVAPIAGPQMEARQIREKAEGPGFINLAQLGVKREIPGGALSAGLNM